MSFEINKIVASILTALIIGMLTGLIADQLITPEKLAKDTYPIAAEAPTSAAPSAPAADKPTPVTADMWAKADPAKGGEIAHKCEQCHTLGKGEPAKIGPNLYGVVGRPRASMPGFSYSDALKKLGGKWTPAEIADFIYNPRLYAPGTKMTFPGLPSPQDRADVIAYLNKNSDSPVDLSKQQ